MCRSFAFAFAALAVAVPSSALPQSADILRAQAGEWLAAPLDGKPGCRISLHLDRTIGGYRAAPSPDCASRLPAIGDASAWSLMDGVRLHDPARRPVAYFREQGDTAELVDEERKIMLLKAAPGVTKLPFASDILGAWRLQRSGGATICSLRLENRAPKGGEESFALSTEPGCDAALLRLKLGSWRIEGATLMLYGTDGASLRMTPVKDGFDKDRSEGGSPLLMRR